MSNKEHYHSTSTESKDASAILSIVQKELSEEMLKFPSKTIALSALSERMQISERTIRRIQKGSHVPNYKTIVKIYRYLKGTLSDREAILSMPLVIRDSFLKDSDNFTLQNEKVEFSADIDYYLQRDSVFRSIYLETAAGTIHRDKVGFEHGQHGLSILDSMIELDVIKEISPNLYSASTRRANLDNKTLKELNTYLVQHKFNVEKLDLKGENFCQFLIEGVDQDTYNDLLKIDWEAKNKRVALLKNSKRGPIKYWHATFTDTLSKSLIYDDHDLPSSKEVIQ